MGRCVVVQTTASSACTTLRCNWRLKVDGVLVGDPGGGGEDGDDCGEGSGGYGGEGGSTVLTQPSDAASTITVTPLSE